jgi:hypothetical protein
MQLDIGFGDVVHPQAEERDYPTLLEMPAPRLRMYPRETVVAEKFEALVKLGTLNTRMKDFFDLWLLASQFDFDGSTLAQAIRKTFENRGTALEPEPVALTSVFTTSPATQKQWTAFIKRTQLDRAPETLEETREPLRRFLLPPAAAIISSRTFADQWKAPGPWQGGR